MKMNLPWPQKLTALLSATESSHAKLEALDVEKSALEKQIEAYIREGDPADMEALSKISLSRTRCEMLPHILKRAEATSDGDFVALSSELERFERALASCGADEREALLIHIEKTFVARGWIANPIEISRTGDPINRARAIAGQLPIFNGIPFEANQLDAPAILSINDNNARIQEALARCRALLAIREKLHTNGGFQPQAFAK